MWESTTADHNYSGRNHKSNHEAAMKCYSYGNEGRGFVHIRKTVTPSGARPGGQFVSVIYRRAK